MPSSPAFFIIRTWLSFCFHISKFILKNINLYYFRYYRYVYTTSVIQFHKYRKANFTMQVFISAFNGKIIAMDVDANSSIKNIKVNIHKTEKIPTNMQRLIYSGKHLKNGRTLSNHNIGKESTLHLIYQHKNIKK